MLKKILIPCLSLSWSRWLEVEHNSNDFRHLNKGTPYRLVSRIKNGYWSIQMLAKVESHHHMQIWMGNGIKQLLEWQLYQQAALLDLGHEVEDHSHYQPVAWVISTQPLSPEKTGDVKRGAIQQEWYEWRIQGALEAIPQSRDESIKKCAKPFPLPHTRLLPGDTGAQTIYQALSQISLWQKSLPWLWEGVNVFRNHFW